MVLDSAVSKLGTGLSLGILAIGTINRSGPSLGSTAGLWVGTIVLDGLGFTLIAWILVIVMIFRFKDVITSGSKKKKKKCANSLATSA